MSRRKLRLGRLLIVALAAFAAFGASAAAAKAPAPKPKIVTVNDFYFGPGAITVKKGESVKWIWSSLNTYPHDVHLKQGPSGLKKKASYSTKTTAVTKATWKDTFTTPGTYKFICTIHPTEMKLTVTVKK
ncbi:MAG: cupredoxin domain-containing protein [Solirubrobacterales bacterium]|nr:cupredoxin domain-containing protein [Solirubrobacterales bacterium]